MKKRGNLEKTKDKDPKPHRTPMPYEFAKKSIPRSPEPESPQFKNLTLPKVL